MLITSLLTRALRKIRASTVVCRYRRLIGQYVTTNNDVISHVNISSVQPRDGGWVTCYATNRFGTISHTARLNIYGNWRSNVAG